jgi:hypothetical protein
MHWLFPRKRSRLSALCPSASPRNNSTTESSRCDQRLSIAKSIEYNGSSITDCRQEANDSIGRPFWKRRKTAEIRLRRPMTGNRRFLLGIAVWQSAAQAGKKAQPFNFEHCMVWRILRLKWIFLVHIFQSSALSEESRLRRQRIQSQNEGFECSTR